MSSFFQECDYHACDSFGPFDLSDLSEKIEDESKTFPRFFDGEISEFSQEEPYLSSDFKLTAEHNQCCTEETMSNGSFFQKRDRFDQMIFFDDLDTQNSQNSSLDPPAVINRNELSLKEPGEFCETVRPYNLSLNKKLRKQ